MRVLTPEQKAAKAAYGRRYRATPERRAAKAKRAASPEGKAYQAEYNRRRRATVEGKAAKALSARRRYATPEGKALRTAAVNRYKVKRGVQRSRDEYHWKYTFGMEPEDYHGMLIAQSGLCAICSKQLFPPTVDHDHTTGIVRGLLCRGCNSALGHFGDTIDGLLIAIDYLRAGE